MNKKPELIKPFTDKPDMVLLKEVAIYLEGIYAGQGDLLPLGKIHLDNLWVILRDLDNRNKPNDTI